jgi:predicted RNA-binding protein
VEPFQDDILSRRLDDVTHQLRMLTLSFSTCQLEQRQQRQSDRWDLAEDTQKALAEMLKIQQTVLEHQRTINGRLAMYVEQQTAINDRLATTLGALKDMLERGNGH